MKDKYPFKIDKVEGFQELQLIEDVRGMIANLIDKYQVIIEANKNLNASSDNRENISLIKRANQHHRNYIENLIPILEKLSS